MKLLYNTTDMRVSLRRARAAAAEVVQSLLAAVSPPQLERLAGFSLEWLSGSDGRLRRAACQVPIRNVPTSSRHALHLKSRPAAAGGLPGV